MILTMTLIHIIGAVITIIIHYKNGTLENASKYGDGFRSARPSDVIVLDCIVWEIELIIFIMSLIEYLINSLFDKK